MLKDFFQWTAPDHGKRPLQACNPPLPPVKRQRLSTGGEQEEHQIQQEKSCLYPCVAYEGDIATVKLGVGQMVMLEGCAMVELVEGHATMLGYSFPRGMEIFVCSSSELMEVVTIEAGQGKYRDAEMEGESEALSCQLRFASHRLGQPCTSGASLSFTLEFVGLLGSSLGKKIDKQLLELRNQVRERNEDNYTHLKNKSVAENRLVEDSFKKRKGCGQNPESGKRQRMAEKLDNYSSSTSLPHKGVESLGSSAPVVAIAMQRMIESLHLLGS